MGASIQKGDAVIGNGKILVDGDIDVLEHLPQSPECIPQVGARGCRRILAPENGREPHPEMGVVVVQEQVSEKPVTLLVGKASQRLATILSLSCTKKT
jgi:hypothetical protein